MTSTQNHTNRGRADPEQSQLECNTSPKIPVQLKGNSKANTVHQAPNNSKREPLATKGLVKGRGFEVQEGEKMRGLVGSNVKINKREGEGKVTHQFAAQILKLKRREDLRD